MIRRLLLNSHILIVRLEDYDSALCTEFNLYSIENILQSFLDGSTGQGEFDKKERLFNIILTLPPQEERANVARLLQTIDQKIDLNNKVNIELGRIARLLFDYWFVQFDFPDKDGNPYKSSGGEMIYNPELKRSIPADWDDGRLSDIAHIIMGQSPPGSSYNESGEGIVFFQGCTDFGERFP